MRQAISIFFLSAYLLASTQLSELLKLPMLVQHYQEHKLENQHLSFLAFLDMHYAHGSPKDADYDRDMKLPFKTIISTTILSIPFPIAVTQFSCLPRVDHRERKTVFATYTCTYCSAYLSAIWQPPKSC